MRSHITQRNIVSFLFYCNSEWEERALLSKSLFSHYFCVFDVYLLISTTTIPHFFYVVLFFSDVLFSRLVHFFYFWFSFRSSFFTWLKKDVISHCFKIHLRKITFQKPSYELNFALPLVFGLSSYCLTS